MTDDTHLRRSKRTAAPKDGRTPAGNGGIEIIIAPTLARAEREAGRRRAEGSASAVIAEAADARDTAEAIRAVRDGEADTVWATPRTLRSQTLRGLAARRGVRRVVLEDAQRLSPAGPGHRADYPPLLNAIKEIHQKYNAPLICETTPMTPWTEEGVRAALHAAGIEAEMHIATPREAIPCRAECAADLPDAFERLCETLREEEKRTIVLIGETPDDTSGIIALTASLRRAGIDAHRFHDAMRPDERDEARRALGEGPCVIVTDAAFLPGLDAERVERVIHFGALVSLEEYEQAALLMPGAERRVISDEQSADTAFLRLTDTRVTVSQIQQTWRAIKRMCARNRGMTLDVTTGQLIREAGWDAEGESAEASLHTALLMLEQAGYIRLDGPMPDAGMPTEWERRTAWFASSDGDRDDCTNVLKYILSDEWGHGYGNREITDNIDHIARATRLEEAHVRECIALLENTGLMRDMRAHMDMTGRDERQTSRDFGDMADLETYLAEHTRGGIQCKRANDAALDAGLRSSAGAIKAIVACWIDADLIRPALWIRSEWIRIDPRDGIEGFPGNVKKCISLSARVHDALLRAHKEGTSGEGAIGFSLLGLYHRCIGTVDRDDPGDSIIRMLGMLRSAVCRLAETGGIPIEGAFKPYSVTVRIERLVTDNRRMYRKTDYEPLESAWHSAIERIHIARRFTKLLCEGNGMADEFLDEYFRLERGDFLTRHLPGMTRENLMRPITRELDERVFGMLDAQQAAAVRDEGHRITVVAGGAGCGVTTTLDRAAARFILADGIRPEQILILTHSPVASVEAARRMQGLVGVAAARRMTVRSFRQCLFDVLGRTCTASDAPDIEARDIEALLDLPDVDASQYAKSCLIIDDAQNLTANEYGLVTFLMEHNPGMRLIAGGDDGQAVMGVLGGSARYMKELRDADGASFHTLDRNHRNARALTDAADALISVTPGRMREEAMRPESMRRGSVECICSTSESVERITSRVAYDHKRFGETFGQAAVLTSTNADAAQAAALLEDAGIPCRLVPGNTSVRLDMLDETHLFFGEVRRRREIGVRPREYRDAQDALREAMAESRNLPDVMRFLDHYQEAKGVVYTFELTEALHLTRLSDITQAGAGQVHVSTFRQARGRVFDAVYCDVSPAVGHSLAACLQPGGAGNPEDVRALYVGMTRARRRLVMFDSSGALAPIRGRLEAAGARFHEDARDHPEPDVALLPLTPRDVRLGDQLKESFQEGAASRVRSGDRLDVHLFDQRDGKQAVLFTVPGVHGRDGGFRASSRLSGALAPYLSDGFTRLDATVDAVLWGHDRRSGSPLRIILPLLRLHRDRPSPASR